MYEDDKVLQDLIRIQNTLQFGGYYATNDLLWQMIGEARKKVETYV